MSHWLFNVCMDRGMKEVKMGVGRRRVRVLEDGREGRLPGLLYVDDLVLCGESEEDLRAMVGQFAEVCKKRGLKVNATKSKVMVLNRLEGLECEFHVDGIRLEHISQFKYFGCVLDESGTDGQDAVGRWRAGGGLQVLGICSLSVLESSMKHCLYLFLCMADGQPQRITRY